MKLNLIKFDRAKHNLSTTGMSLSSKQRKPIGIFDSGIGGLTVAHAIKKALPHENMIYFGDTAHLPYGDKSEAAIQAYSVRITNILLQKGCKVIVIACNSASSAAYELLKEYVRKDTHIINVIDPMVALVARQYQKKTSVSSAPNERCSQVCTPEKYRKRMRASPFTRWQHRCWHQ
jgi:glutamate racemase